MKSLVFVLFVLILGCTPKEIEDNSVEINIASVEEGIKSDFFFSKRKIVPLETNDNSIIGEIRRIILTTNNILIFDQFTHSVKIFDNDGKFINAISRIGRGPGEYQSLTDISYNNDTDELILYCDRPNKIIQLKLDGSFIKEKQFKGIFYRFSYINNHYFFYNPFFEPGVKHFVAAYDKNLNPVNKYIFNDLNHKSYIESFSPNIVKSHSLNVTVPLSNLVYSYENKTITPSYRINFGEKQPPLELLTSNMDNQERLNSLQEYYHSITNFRNNGKFISFSFRPAVKCFYNIKTKKSYSFKSIKDEFINLHMSNYIAHDGDDEFCIFLLEPQFFHMSKNSIPESARSLEKFKYLMELTHNVRESDNPVLVIYSFN